MLSPRKHLHFQQLMPTGERWLHSLTYKAIMYYRLPQRIPCQPDKAFY